MPGDHRMFVPAVAFIVLMLLPGLALSSELTLDQALGRALSENLSIANAELEIEASKYDLESLKTRRYPNIELRGGVSYNQDNQNFILSQGVLGDYAGIGEIPATDVPITSRDDVSGFLSANISQPLSQQIRIARGIEQSEVKVDIANQNLLMTQTQLANMVKRDYFNILALEHQWKTTQKSIEFYTSLQNLVGNYVEQKMALKYELLDVKARLAHRQVQAQVEENDLATLKQRMNKLLNRDLETAFSIVELPEASLTSTRLPLNEALDKALQQKPEIKTSKLQVQSAKLGYEIKKSEYIPDVDLRLRYSRLYGTEFIPERESYIGIHAKWEIFDWNRKRRELGSKAMKIEQAINNLHSRQEEVKISVRRSYRAIFESRNALDAAKLSLTAADEKLRVLMNQYAQQVVLLQDVLDAETEQSRAGTQYNRSVLGVWRAEADLQKALGEV